MDTVISIFSAKKRPKPETAKPLMAGTYRPPSGPLVGTCTKCGKPIAERDAVDDDGQKLHFNCLMDETKLKGWRSSLGWMYWQLAPAFARALGKDRVKPIIDPFFDGGMTFAETFKAFTELERMLRTTPGIAEDITAAALKALAACKDQFRLYARLP